jgi:hypothetical protein
MTDSQDRAIRFSYFLLGVTLPLAGWAIWSRFRTENTKAEAESALDDTVEDSFPASDPPASW